MKQHHDHQHGPDHPAASRRTSAISATTSVASVTYVDSRGRGPRRRCGRHRAGRSETGSAPSPAARTRRRTPSDACSASSRPASVPHSSHDASLKSSGSPSSTARRSRAAARTTCDIAQADEERRHGDEEAGDRSGDADVEQHRACSGIGSRMRMNAPSVPVSRQRHRQKIRQRRVDVDNSGRRSSGRARGAEDRQDRRRCTRGRAASSVEPHRQAGARREVRA